MRSVVLGATALSLSILTLVAFVHSPGMPGNYSGAPAVRGATCAACHGDLSGPGRISIAAPAIYARGSVIPVTVSLHEVHNAAANGYHLTAYAANEQLRGWVLPDSDSTLNESNVVMHTKAGTSETSWRAYLTTTKEADRLTLYAAALHGNHDNHASHDFTYATAVELEPGVVNLCMMGLPRIRSEVPLALHAPEDAGRRYVMAASRGNSGLSIGERNVPLALDTLAWLTISNSLPGVFMGFQGELDQSGRAIAHVIIPEDLGLRGLAIYCAYVVLDHRRPGGISTISNGLPLMIH